VAFGSYSPFPLAWRPSSLDKPIIREEWAGFPSVARAALVFSCSLSTPSTCDGSEQPSLFFFLRSENPGLFPSGAHRVCPFFLPFLLISHRGPSLKRYAGVPPPPESLESWVLGLRNIVWSDELLWTPSSLLACPPCLLTALSLVLMPLRPPGFFS